MKTSVNGQAKILTAVELKELFSNGFTSARDRALFGICLYTCCRVSEALALTPGDIRCNVITLRKATTKGKVSTRQIDIHPNLKLILDDYMPGTKALFPGAYGRGHLTRYAADKLLRAACKRVGLEGVSTHSFRRTALTTMNDAGIPLRTIQKISGHKTLSGLQEYLEVTPDQKRSAIAALVF